MERNYEKEKTWLLEEKYGGVPNENFHRDALRVERGEPLAYVIGGVPFLGCDIALGKRVLIPRAETEHWVARALPEIKSAQKILDLCAGSGCIGITILSHIPGAIVDFADIDPAAIQQIKKNISLNGINERRARVIKSDLFKKIDGSYDIIFANPPYINERRKRHVQKSVLDFEPHRALFAGDDGLALIKKIIDGATKHLRVGGTLFVEFDSWQKPLIEKYLRARGKKGKFLKDQYGKWRVLKMNA
ncbi:peptide chain release factor N(5)-glutamine methyltransferase [bacterium]|nr:peptide chain release factor N(5)-glutamine methyltransferase [bacterium]MCI0679937.1 peptide chain release factor N(5)-glutamine methyltransferase [bacterium]